MVGHGRVRYGEAGKVGFGKAWSGQAGCGAVRRGKARQYWREQNSRRVHKNRKEATRMNDQEFYAYIRENYNLASETFHLILNIIDHVECQEFKDAETAREWMSFLLNGVIAEKDVALYRANECSKRGMEVVASGVVLDLKQARRENI